jgi:PAS domain S-box-containing protein
MLSPARMEVLGLIASEAAISLEHAQLHADLKQAQERTQQAEQEVRRIVDGIPAMIWTASLDGRVNYVNQRWLDYGGRSLEEWRGWGWMSDVHPVDLDRWRTQMQSFLPAGRPGEIELRVRGADGTYRWFLCRMVPLRDAAGQMVGWCGTAIDIEDRKRAEQSLRRSEAHLAQAQRLSRTGSCQIRFSPEEEVVWSKETLRLLGFDETTEPSVEKVLERIHPEDVPLVRQALEAARSGASLDLELRLVMPGGSVKQVHVITDTMKDDSGNVDLIGSVQDITASKRAFEETRALRDRLFQENVALRAEVDEASMFEDIVGNSPSLRAVLSRVSKVAPTDSTALITGETGTGKELIARAIHRRSPRSSRPFVAVNCAVIPKDLIASELFGHEKGAFTGAVQRKLGRFELAEGGTLLLDELGEIPPEIQVALLRVLQERRFERVGGTQPISSDVRVIAATNVDLDAAMNAGAFRRDLFYRLNVFPIEVPSLRERREDIPLLVEYFIERFATQAGKRFSRIDKKSLDLLKSYDWPGNIRELQNVIERSVIVCDANEFSVDEHWLASPALAKEPKLRTLDEQLIREERKLIEAALSESGGKVSGSAGAAVKLGMPATTLYSKIQSLQIDRRRFKRS